MVSWERAYMVTCETPLIRFNEPHGTFLVYYLIGFDFAGPIGPLFYLLSILAKSRPVSDRIHLEPNKFRAGCIWIEKK